MVEFQGPDFFINRTNSSLSGNESIATIVNNSTTNGKFLSVFNNNIYFIGSVVHFLSTSNDVVPEVHPFPKPGVPCHHQLVPNLKVLLVLRVHRLPGHSGWWPWWGGGVAAIFSSAIKVGTRGECARKEVSRGVGSMPWLLVWFPD